MYISANGISTYFERAGSGQSIVLIHALGSSMRSWEPISRVLSQGYDVLAYDWRGHGRTEKTIGEVSLPLLASDLSELLARLGIERATVVGVAVGAMIALQAALDHADQVRALVLAEGCAEIDPSVEKYTAERAERVEREGMRVAAELTIERAFSPGFGQRHPDALHEFRGDFLANDPRAYASASRVVIGHNVTRRLGEIRCPTLLLVGELDRLLPPAASRLIEKHIEGSQLETLPGVGHFSPIEVPELFASRVSGFLEALHGDVP